MSTTLISVFVLILSQVLPLIGITVESQSLESTIQTIVALVSGLTIWIQRMKLRKIGFGEVSDVTMFGMRRK